MKKIKEQLVLFWKNIRECIKKNRDGPPKPLDIGNCVHCGRPFERPSIGSGEPVIECRHENGTAEYVFRYPSTWRVKITRQKNGNCPASHAYLEFCEFCFWMKPRFISFRFERSAIHYIWETERKERYERYDYGRGPILNAQ